MPFILAVEVDPVAIGSLVVTVLTVAGSSLTTAWFGIKKLCVYLWKYVEPKITKAIDEHTNLVSDMRANVPVVAGTMSVLAETQKQQCNTLQKLSEASSRHEELHAQTGAKLDQIIGKLSSRDLPTMSENRNTQSCLSKGKANVDNDV